MALMKEQKTHIIKGLSEKIAKSHAMFVVDFKGMSVEEMTNLRKKLHPHSEIQVVKNTLIKRALLEHESINEVLGSDFQDTNAFVFSYDEPNETAKGLVDYMKDVEALELKRGYFDSQKLDKDKIKYLAKIPSKDELRAQLLGVFQAPMSKFLRTLKEVPSSFVRVLAQKKDKQKE